MITRKDMSLDNIPEGWIYSIEPSLGITEATAIIYDLLGQDCIIGVDNEKKRLFLAVSKESEAKFDISDGCRH